MMKIIYRNYVALLCLLLCAGNALYAAAPRNSHAAAFTYYAAGSQEGLIGATEDSPVDNPADNIFHVAIDEALLGFEQVWLEYELEGVADHTAVARSINDQLAVGGYLVKKRRGWALQRERVDARWLKQGDNVIRFSMPQGASHSYRVRNISLQVDRNLAFCQDGAPELVINLPRLHHNGQAYVKGFLAGAVADGAKVTIDGKAARLYKGEFEAMVTALDKWGRKRNIAIEAQLPNGQILCQQLAMDQVQQADYSFGLEMGVHATQKFFAPEAEASILLAGAELSAKARSLKQASLLSITSLRAIDLPALDPGMVNVTRYHEGYRFLPHGTQFEKDVKLRLAYDESKIPDGYTAQDIKTYYFDEESHHWVPLPLDSAVQDCGDIFSRTTHFTDMINAIIQVPESPEVQAYNSTSMKGIKAANPMAGFNLMNPPQANNTGSASMGYPLNLPAGRSGMQPQLAICYNSGGGNDWLGLGWNLSIPAITVDTRWGVPRYDDQKETETYSMGGEQLSPVAHRGELQDRNTSGNKQFYPRVEGAFNKIIRHGKNPTEYSWEVTTKSGVKYYYGGSNRRVEENAVLKDAAGNIAHWALVKVEDLNGNYVLYEYEKQIDAGVAGGSVDGYQLYPIRIKYTGHTSDNNPPYQVYFKRDRVDGFPNGKRQDVSINARYGFKQVTADLLERIIITYNGNTVRSYELKYEKGSKDNFYKTLLTDIIEYDAGDQKFAEHNFVYYNDLAENNGPYKQDYLTWRVQKDDVKTTDDLVPSEEFSGKATLLSGTKSKDFSAGVAVTVGAAGDQATKSNSAGANAAYASSTSEGMSMMIDMNGDGLPDKLYKLGSQLYYRPNLGFKEGSSPGGSSAFNFGEDEPLTGASDFQLDKSRTISGGLEAHVGYGIANVTAGYTRAKTTTNTTIYIADVNGDQLPDIVDNGKVFFNYLNERGVPTFVEQSGFTPSEIFAGGSIEGGLVEVDASEMEEAIDKNPLHDVVRVWIAPYNGKISITAPVSLVPVAPEEEDPKADGVRVAIQLRDTELWWKEIAARDFSEHTPSNVLTKSVRKGDRLYFRVQSQENGAEDKVHWAPQIRYSNQNPRLLDANGKPVYRFSLEEDYVVSAPQTITAPYSGTIAISGLFSKAVTTDDVLVQIVKRSKIDAESDAYTADEVVEEEFFAWDVAVEKNITAQDVRVEAGDQFNFRVRSTTNINWSELGWEPRMHYTAADDPDVKVFDDAGQPSIVFDPVPDLGMYNEQFRLAQPWVLSQADSDTVAILPVLDLQKQQSLLFKDVPLVFSIKKENQLVMKDTFLISNDSLPAMPTYQMPMVKGEKLFVEYHTPAKPLIEFLRAVDAQLATEGDTIDLQAGYYAAIPLAEQKFGPLYRGWGHFAYKGNRELATQPIQQNLLEINTDIEDPGIKADEIEDGNELEGKDLYDPAAEQFIVLVPVGGKRIWNGYDNYTWLDGTYVQSSRYGADDIEPMELISGTGATAVNKVSSSTSNSYSAGVNATYAGAGYSKTDGTSWVKTDYMDLNGDRYPDIVTDKGIQYTDARGGFSNRVFWFDKRADDIGEVNHKTITYSEGPSFSATPVMSKEQSSAGNAKKKSISVGDGRNSAGISAQAGEGYNYTDFTYADINGDGLADRINQNGKVALNLGYSFADDEYWHTPIKQGGTSASKGGGLGFSIIGGSISAGVGLSLSDNDVMNSLQDMNGDGLADLLKVDDGTLYVQLNTGNSFEAAIPWASVPAISKSEGMSQSGNLGFTASIPIMAVKISVNIHGSGGMGVSREMSGLRDVDGDGYPDLVKSDDDGHLEVKASTIGRTNLLKEVKRPMGASFALSYEQVGNTYEMPNSTWVLSSVEVQDGYEGDGKDRLLNTFAYEDGLYHRHERDFYGFGKVISRTHDTGDGEKVYTQLVQTFSTENYYTKGLLLKERLEDAKGKPYVEKENIYQLRSLSTETGASEAAPRGGKTPELEDAPLVEGGRMFPMLTETWQRFYEGLDQPGKSTRSEFAYDAWGNVTLIKDWGDSGSEDDLFATVKYHYLENEGYLMGMPSEITVKGSDKTYRRREADINPNGQVKQIRQFLNEEEAAVHDLKYDPYGNLEKIIRPANAKEQRLEVSYTYDDQVHTYVTRTHNSYDYSSEATYDYKFGQPLTSKDLNGQEIRYQLDDVGRVTHITGPYEIKSGAEYTIHFVYHPNEAIPWALTEHYDPEHLENPLQTVTFVDGLGRVLQTKKDAAIYQGDGTADKEMMIASGKVLYDGLGRAVEAYYPVLGKANAPGEFIAEVDAINPTTTKYDVLGRATEVALPDGAITRGLYGFDPDREGNKQFMTKTIDANEKATEQFTDVRGRVTAVKNAGDVWTSFVYNAMGEQLQAINDLGHTTLSEYDLLGRRIRREHPDAGVTEYRYDLVGNLTELITANLKEAGAGAITYDYDFERLMEIHYPQNPENDVKYTYGPAGAPENRAGRIERQEDASGVQDFYYGALGEVVKNVRTIIIPQHEEQTFVTEWSYDTWNRLTGMTYADGEKLEYTYNVGGLLHSMKGKKKGTEYKYVQQLGYDKFEQRVFLHYGNGTKTNYEYEPDRRRLKNMVAKTANGRAMMDNIYEYDKVNNILSLKNVAPIPTSNLMGGASEYHYQYDDLYRLTEAQGSFKGSSQEHRYSLSMQYNTVGGIENKTQTHDRKGNGQNEWVSQNKTTYQLAYAYGTEQPNASVHIGEMSDELRFV